jgi:dipeptidase D
MYLSKKDNIRRFTDNMSALSNLEPKNVFKYFEDITKIPHGSGNVDKISDYLVQFARERNLFYIQDELKNVIIIKDSSEGYENEPAVILQGHMDMVAVHKPDYDIDMKTEGLKAMTDGDNIYAEGTSLGGDDGIALAYALAVLDSDTLKHPRIEAVFTVDEEVGMDGAREIDLSMLEGHRMINLDSEEEGIFLTSCAGGARVKPFIPVNTTQINGISYEIEIGGLKGGHSGEEIDKERANANCLFGRILRRLTDKINVGLVSVDGGLADNAIPRETKAVVAVEAQDSAAFAGITDSAAAQIASELASKDASFYVHVRACNKGSIKCASFEDTRKVAAFLFTAPCGVQAMSLDIKGLVETSLNLGILKYDVCGAEGGVKAEFSVRSSIESAKANLIDKLVCLAEMCGGETVVTGDYPGWKYRADSPLRSKMITLYKKMYNKEPKVEAIHAGLECGLLGSKIEDLDCVSIGPDMKNIHTTEETLSITSTRRVWEYLTELLALKD